MPKEQPSSDPQAADHLEQTVRRLTQGLAASLAKCDELLNRGTAREARPYLFSVLDETLTQLAATDCWGPANRLPSSILWSGAREWLERGQLQRRAREKPRGYAGDHQMLDEIWRNARCEDPLGHLLDDYFQSQAAPQAVRHRMQIVGDAIVESLRESSGKPFQLVSVGAGAAHDVAFALGQLDADERARLRILLLDMDPEALEFAASNLGRFLPDGLELDDWLRTERQNLFRLAQPGRLEWLVPQAHMLVCPGLFDYLGEGEAVRMLKAFREPLGGGHRMLVFNFAQDNPTRAYMEWIGNWYLIHRSEADMERLAERSLKTDDRWRRSQEPLGVNLYLDVAVSP